MPFYESIFLFSKFVKNLIGREFALLEGEMLGYSLRRHSSLCSSKPGDIASTASEKLGLGSRGCSELPSGGLRGLTH